jgi:hypothetical protein
MMAALLVAGAALIWERRLIGAPWRRIHRRTFDVPSEFTPEEVSSWYAELPGNPAPEPSTRPPSRFLARSIEVGGGLITGWIIVAVILLVVSTFLAGRFARRLGPDTATLAELVSGSDRGSTLADAKAVMQGYLPAGTNEADSDTLLAALLIEPPRGLPLYPVEPRTVLGSKSRLAATTLVQDALRRATEFSADTLKIMSELGDHPRTTAVRTLARARAVTFPVEGDMSSAIRTAVEANAAGAVVAAARGNLTEAAARLGENASIADLAVTAPGPYWPETGLRMLQSLALLPLAEVERLRGNKIQESGLRRAAVGISETIYRFGPSLRLGAIGLGGDPRDLRLLRLLQDDRSIPTGLRAAAVEESGNAVCLNPREWLAGASPSRRTELGASQVLPDEFRTRGIGGVVARIRYCSGLSKN